MFTNVYWCFFTYVYACLFCLPMFTYFHKCFPLFTRFYLCVLVLTTAYSFIPMFTTVYSGMLTNVYSCWHYGYTLLPMITDVDLCLLIKLVYLCLPIFTRVYLCLPLSTPVYLCLPLFTSVYLSLLMFAVVYLCMSTYVDTCLHMLAMFTPFYLCWRKFT